MPDLLDRILQPEGLSLRLQPIFRARSEGWRLHAFECLSRGPAGTSVESASVLFTYARCKRAEILVDRACVSRALSSAPRLLESGPPEGSEHRLRINLNVHATTLCRDETFPRHLLGECRRFRVDPSRLTVEIVEHQPARDLPRLLDSLETLRAEGTHVALDDVGMGYSNYRMLVDCSAEYLKLDRYLVASSHRDPRRGAVVRSLATLAADLGAEVVAEGIESPADLALLLDCRIDLVQGYLLGIPLEEERARALAASWKSGEGELPPVPAPSPGPSRSSAPPPSPLRIRKS